MGHAFISVSHTLDIRCGDEVNITFERYKTKNFRVDFFMRYSTLVTSVIFFYSAFFLDDGVSAGF